jgi:hypothetical protein
MKLRARPLSKTLIGRAIFAINARFRGRGCDVSYVNRRDCRLRTACRTFPQRFSGNFRKRQVKERWCEWLWSRLLGKPSQYNAQRLVRLAPCPLHIHPQADCSPALLSSPSTSVTRAGQIPTELHSVSARALNIDGIKRPVFSIFSTIWAVGTGKFPKVCMAAFFRCPTKSPDSEPLS